MQLALAGGKKYETFFPFRCPWSPPSRDGAVHDLRSRRTSQPRANPGSRSGCLNPMPPGCRHRLQQFVALSNAVAQLSQRVHAPDRSHGRQWLNPVATQIASTLFRSSTASSRTWCQADGTYPQTLRNSSFLQRVLHHFGQLRGGDTSQRHEAETDGDDIRRATLSLGTAFTVLMSSWPGFKGMGIRVSAVDTVRHLPLVITTDLFLSSADTLHTIWVGLLAKQGVRDDRLGALFEMRDLVNSTWQPQPAAIVDGLQRLIAGVHPAVGVWLSELILILGEGGFLTPAAHGSLQQMANHEEKVFLHCLLFSLTRPRETRSYVSILLPKNLPEGQAASRCATAQDSFWVSLRA